MNCKILIADTITPYFCLIDNQKREKGKELPTYHHHRVDCACRPLDRADKLVCECLRTSGEAIR